MVNSEGAAAPAVPPVQKRLTEGEKDHWRMVDRMLAHILAKVPTAVRMGRLCAWTAVKALVHGNSKLRPTSGL